MQRRLATAALGLALILTLGGAAHSDAPVPPPAAPAHDGLNPANIDTSASPGTDFYQYAVGGWLKTHPIPPEFSAWGTFNQLAEDNTAKLHGILDGLRQDAAAGTNERKLVDFYASGMDEAAINKAGIHPIEPELKRIDAIRTVADLEKEVVRLHSDGIAVYFGYGSDQDAKDSTQMIAEINQDGLGMPDRDYYLKTDAKAKATQEKYRHHIRRLLTLAGESPAQAAMESPTIYNYEKAMAQISRTRVALRDPVTNYNRMDVAGLAKVAPTFPWKAYLKDTDTPDGAPINLGQPDYMKGLDRQWSPSQLATARLYLRWHLLNASARYLSKAFVDEDFDFRLKTLRGNKANKPRWKRVVATIDDGMGEALGKLYVDKYFPPEAKEKALAMVHNLEGALRDDLATLSWMSDATRQKALAKLDAFQLKIGYPDKWRDYSALTIDRGPFILNVMRANKFEFHRQIAKIGQPVDRTEWGMTPPTVNAYYNPAMNEIVFPAGILQPPFFDAQADDAVNYGGIGAVIGHEMTHGFDDQGAQFDAQGNLKDWWTKDDLANFKARTKRIQAEYSGFVYDGQHTQGELVTGESLADLGGLTLSYRAFEKTLEGKPRPADIDGYTAEQRFFLAFGQVWAGNLRSEYARLLITTDPHPLPKFRVNGTVSNMPAFAKAWNLKPTDPMVLSDDKRTEIW